MTNKDKWKNTENRQALSDEEVAQASGGGDMSWGCNTPKCMGNYLTGMHPDIQYDICPHCGAKCQWWRV